MIHHLLQHFKTLVVTLRFSILSVFITLFLATTLLIIALNSWSFSHTLTYTSIELMKEATASISTELKNNLEPASTQGELTAEFIREGVIISDDININAEKLLEYAYDIVKTYPLIQSAFFTDEFGNHIHAFEEPNGTITSEIEIRNVKPPTRIDTLHDANGRILNQVKSFILSADGRNESWYNQAKAAKHTIWTDVYAHHGTIGITSASPLYDNKGQFKGIFGLNVSLARLSNFITNQHISEHGYSFIVTKDEKLVAYPKRSPFTDAKDLNHDNMLDVHEVNVPIINASLDQYKKTHQSYLEIKDKGITYLVSYEPIEELAKYGWLIGVVIPKSDFTSQLQKINFITLLVSLIILVLGIWIVSKLITKIVTPIKLLAKETKYIKNLDLDKDISIQSRIKEVIYLRDAIRSMKNGLKSFQKYVPKILVHQLIESGQDIRAGGTRKQLTVLFTDIENFTSIAEEMDPTELLTQLCEYFEEITRIILQEKGTIDKYIGDSVMAFWGAPLYEGHPYEHAAYAAIQCQRKLSELNARWQVENKPMFPTRIGIHTGEAIVGNLGSSDRLNYTALGDTINIASRLEHINKIYQTKIIVSESFYQEIKNKFVFRLVDYVAVKGRTKGSYLYELLAEKIEDLSFDVIRYREIFSQGFNAYKEQKWDEAIDYFSQCLVIYPKDTIAPIFIMRSLEFKITPPGKNWQGITKIGN